ncbi:nitroreductase family protein [Paludibacter sp.]
MNYCFGQSVNVNILDEFVKYGNKAPSSHNAKMWDVSIHPEKGLIILKIDKQKMLPALDPSNRESWISLGAFCQNIKLVAKDYGYNTNIFRINDTVELYFSSINVELEETKIYKEILNERHTLRKEFRKDSIDSLINPILQKYSALIYFKNDTYLYDQLVSLSKKANYQQINDLNRRMELAEWINFEKNRFSGMNLSNLGLNFFERLFFRCFVRKKYFSNSKLIRQSYLTKTNSLYDKGAGFLLITSERNDKNNWFNSGILLEDIWVQLTELDIKVQPMSQVIEEEPYYSQIKKLLNIDGEIQMILRIGKT